MTADQLEEYLRGKALVKIREESSGRHAITSCAVCGKAKHMYVNLSDERLGLWDCKRCGASGHLNALREAFGDKTVQRNGAAKSVKVEAIKDLTAGLERALGRTRRGQSPAPNEKPKNAKKVNPNSPFAFREGLDDSCHTTLMSATSDGLSAIQNPVLQYLYEERKLTKEAIVEFKLGAHLVRVRGGGARWFMTIPVYDPSGRLTNMRFRTIPGECAVCGGAGCDDRLCADGQTKKTYMRCPGRPSALFNAHRLDGIKTSTVNITEGEMDVIAMWMYGVRNVVSGTAGASSWLEEWLDLLEPYDSFLLLYDSDAAGEAGAKSVAQKLGEYRCSRATLPEKDAGDCLISGTPVEEINRAIDRAQPLMDISLRRVDDYMNEIEELINQPESLRGLPSGSEKLDSCIGGWRSGLVVVTGDTGAGKTTFTTWVALEQARAHVPVLLTSFEQRPIGTVQKLLRAQIGGDFAQATKEERATALGELGKLPIHIVDHYGHMEPERVIEAVRYAVRRHDVKMAVIDHLGFLVDPSAPDERRAIENVVRALATCAVYDKVTLVLVAHPSRLHHSQQRRVKIQDLKGASAIEQDAHMGLVVARVLPNDEQAKTAAWVYVDKVRSEFGLPGSKCYLYFDREACVFADKYEDTPAAIHEQHKPVTNGYNEEREVQHD